MPATAHFSFKNPEQTERGLRAYRANAQALSVTSLQACYPVLEQMLGSENFAHLAQDHWQAMPPERGDLAHWGQHLAAYLLQVPQLQALLAEHPYLCDVARTEWALHAAATATDVAHDAASFQLLARVDPEQLRLQLAPGCALVRSAYPIVAFMQLHTAHGATASATARELITSAQPQTALIWRQGWRPTLAAVDAASAAMIEATLQGQSLAAAVDAALAQAPDFDFGTWLAEQVQAGVLLAAITSSSLELASS